MNGFSDSVVRQLVSNSYVPVPCVQVWEQAEEACKAVPREVRERWPQGLVRAVLGE